MSVWECFRIALEAIGSNRVRSFLTMLGVIIGVTSVIVLVSVGQGASDAITGQIRGMGSDLLFVRPGKAKGGGGSRTTVVKLRLDDAQAIERRAPSVAAVAPIVSGQTSARAGNRRFDAAVLGVTASYVEVRNLAVSSGSFVDEGDVDRGGRVAVIGAEVARELFGAENPLGQRIKIDDARFLVKGVMLEAGKTFGENPDERIYVPLPAAQELFAVEGVSFMYATPRASELVESAQEEIGAVLRARHGGREEFTIQSQSALVEKLQTITNTFRTMLGVIAGISLLVGGIGIMNIMLVSVRERTREIGIRKAIGAKRRDILLQFLIEAVTLSTVGGVIGIAIGIVGAGIAERAQDYLPTTTTPWSVVVAFLFAVAVGVFFGVYPAMKASDLDPIECLRYE